MKKIFTLLLFTFITHLGFSQCEYIGGDFETYLDVTDLFDENDVLPDGTVITPEAHTSIFRFITIFFTSLFLDPASPEYQEIWSNGFGLSMSDDALTGSAALRIEGDEVISVADVYTVIACDGTATGLELSYKHMGEGSDTLTVMSLMVQGFENIPEDDEDLESAPFYISWEIVVDSTQDEYTTVMLPFIDNMLGATIDTAATFMIVSGDPDFFEGGGESYYLIDNVSFISDSAPVDEDMDGFTSDVDCDDMNADINPDAVEIPNNDIDEDCDGTALVIDEDMDGFNSDDDCDDMNPNINPDAVEIPNNDIDEDCDGTALIIDEDMDGFNSDDDCDDMNADINPDAVEVPNNDIDEDCDGVALIIDEDMDGFNSDDDCDDMNPDINPDAEEIPDNGIDEDCDGMDLMTATNDEFLAQIAMYPNPANSILTLTSEAPISYTIINTNGKQMKVEQNYARTHTIDLLNSAEGVYFIKCVDKEGNIGYKKLIKN